jgi:cobalamin biosynthesis protein CobD/CbiB
MGSISDLPPVIWVGVGVTFIISMFVKGTDQGDPWARAGGAAVVILVAAMGLLLLGVDWAWDLLDWLLGSSF